MRRMRHCGIADEPVILLEGDEDRYQERQGMTEPRRKAVKTFRDMLRAREYFPDFRVVETRHVSGTAKWLIGEMRRVTERFRRGGGRSKVGTWSSLLNRVEETMRDQTFRYYLGLVNLAGVGEKRVFSVMEKCTTVEALAEVCEREDCVDVMTVWKTYEGKGGRKLGKTAAEAVRNWCVTNSIRIREFPNVPYALPFGSPSIAKTRSSVIIQPL